MKRSRHLTLILMGSLSLAGLGCSSEPAEEEGMHAFTSVNECVASGLFDEAQCQQLALEAVQQAPHFTSLEECEAKFGTDACVNPAQRNGESGGFWMPMLAGFLAGRFLGGGGMMYGAQGLFRQPGANGQPVYRTASGDVIKTNAAGRVLNPASGVTQNMRRTAKPTVARKGAVRARGGFSGGARASS